MKEKCECKHNGSTYSKIFCEQCGIGNCKKCINAFEQYLDKWSLDWKVPLYVEARQELIDYVKNI